MDIDKGIVKKHLTKTLGHTPTASMVNIYISKLKNFPSEYTKIAKDYKMPPVKKTAVPAKKPAAPNFPAQVKALIPTGKQTITTPYKADDVEMGTYLDVIKQELRKKYGGTWKPTYKKALKTVLDNAKLAPDATQYLLKVVKILNPSYKPWNPTQSVKPGEWHGLPTPTDPLTPGAKKFLPAPDKAKQAAELAKQIEDYTAEINRLKALQKTATTGLDKANKAKKKLAGIDEQVLKYFSYIDKNCSDFLKVAKQTKKLLYRGQDDASLPIFVGYPRADREPKDSNKAAQALADKYLTMMGFKALRSNSLFCTSNFGQADGYGNVYAIFPKNGFHYTWSTEHDDLVIDSVSQLKSGGHGGYGDDGGSEVYYEIEDDLGLILQYCTGSSWNDKPEDYYSDDLDWDFEKANKTAKALKADPNFKELVKHCKVWYDKIDEDSDEEKIYEIAIKIYTAYLAIPASFKFKPDAYAKSELTRATKALAKLKPTAAGPGTGEKAMAKKVIDNYGFLKDKLDSAMKAGHEICMMGEYVAVDYRRYKNALREFFLGIKSGSNNYDDDEYSSSGYDDDDDDF